MASEYEQILVTFENLSEGTTAQFLDDLEASFKDLLVLLQHAVLVVESSLNFVKTATKISAGACSID